MECSFYVHADQDDDGIISREEFVMLPPEESEYAMQNAEKEWQEERMKEFNDVIDLDGDGKLTKEELLVGWILLLT